MHTAAIYIKTDPEVKLKAQKVAKEIGVSLSSLLNAWLRDFIRTKTVTFSTRNETPSQYLIDSIKQAEKDIKEGNVSPAFKTGKEAVEWLEKQGI
ncbi:MAG: Uncharacterized protein CEO21_97 [Microgenomates group bacterium Gr01-1014_80]|nr:MAG: Uncharacterized protein CEO21_97 [Microgenomates group bacterium Gr01-1014_80]